MIVPVSVPGWLAVLLQHDFDLLAAGLRQDLREGRDVVQVDGEAGQRAVDRVVASRS